MALNPSDLFLVNSGGKSYKVQRQNLSGLSDNNALVLISDSGVSKKVKKSNWDKIPDNAWLLCNQGGQSYKISGANFKSALTTAFYKVTNSSGIVGGSEGEIFDGNDSTYGQFGADNTGEPVVIDFQNAAGRLEVNGSVSIKVDGDGYPLEVSLGGLAPQTANGQQTLTWNNINFIPYIKFRRTGGLGGSGKIYSIKINGQHVTMGNRGQGLANP